VTQASPGKFDRLPRIPAGSTALAFDGYGLRDASPARPAGDASYPVSVRQAAVLLHTSFRHRLAVMPLCFAKPSPPSGWLGNFHPQAIERAGHATERLRRKGRWGVDAERLGVFFEWAGLDLRARYSKDGRPP
jgi:hypothetical protein